MANAAADKLKDFGLRQGEKIVVGVTLLVLGWGVYLLATKPTIELTPQALATKAEQADSNLSRRQEPDAIKAAVAEAGIKDPGLLAMVDSQEQNKLKPGDFRSRLDWVTPEPGAGLIRDQPDLIAPTELLAFPGRGGMVLFAVDEKTGDRIPDPTASAASVAGRGGRPGSSPAAGASKPSAEDKAQQDREAARRTQALAGKAAPKKEEEKKAEEVAAAPQEVYKEELKGKRWVVLTAVIDNEQMNKNWLAALKNPAIAFPQYVKVNVHRQVKQDDGTWTEWAPIDYDANYRTLDNATAAEEELIPPARLLTQLVDQLPLLQAGYWAGVHVARLVPEDKLKAPEQDFRMGMGPGGNRGGSEMMDNMSPGMSSPSNGMRAGSGSMGGEMSGGPGGMMGPGSGGGGAPEEQVVANTEPALMIRALDFTVEANTTYRYRIRVVVKNPNFDRNDVNPGVDTTSEFLTSPWSATTEAISVRADVSAYAQNPIENPRRDGTVMFQVVRWDPTKGYTVVKTDEAGPGQMIGEEGGVQMPTSDGKPAYNATIDFNSRSLVLDVQGGRQRIPDLGIDRNQFTVPAVAVVLEPDGSAVIRSQARDLQDEVRKDMESNYQQAIKDSGGKKSSNSSRMMNSRSGRAGS